MKPAAFSDTHPPARHWEKRVLVAYLRMMGLTQHAAGKAVGRAARTVRDWEADTVTWAQARGAAEARWLGELTDAARQTLLAAIRGGAGDLALRVLERTVQDLARATQRVQHEVGHWLSSLLKAFEGHDADTE